MSTQSATGYTNTSYLANGTTYYYKVRALKANGTASAYSSVVTITYGTVPPPLPLRCARPRPTPPASP